LDITSIHGIAIRAHVSALIAFFLLVFLLAGVYFPAMLPAQVAVVYWSVAFISTLFLFLSTIAHELGHSLVARVRGIPVEAITLVMFGGSSDIRSDNERPIDEFLIAISGPLVSLVLAGIAAAARLSLPTAPPSLILFLEAVLILNVYHGVFNLLPTLPLDGGRALRGLLWQQLGDYRRATHGASIVGQFLAAILLGVGLVLFVASIDATRTPIPAILGYDPRVIGLIAIVAAWYMNSRARSAYRQIVMQGKFAGAKVSELMTAEPTAVDPWTRLDEIVSEHFLEKGERAVAVVRDDDLLVGLVAYSDVSRVPRHEWANRAAGEVMTPVASLVTVGPNDSVETAIRHMAERHLNQLPVVVDGRMVGMIARVNVLRFLDPTGGLERKRR
jgi:Zn-dependent protease/CBS domain-containing protein